MPTSIRLARSELMYAQPSPPPAPLLCPSQARIRTAGQPRLALWLQPMPDSCRFRSLPLTQDLLTLLADYGGAGDGNPSSDINGDGSVNVEDLLALLAAYGQQTDCGTFLQHFLCIGNRPC